MNDTQEALDVVYQGGVKPITLDDERRTSKMELKSNIFIKAYHILAALCLVYAAYQAGQHYHVPYISHPSNGVDPLEALEPEELGYMRQIFRYCQVGSAERSTCLLWHTQYKQLLTGERQEVALFSKDSTHRIAETLHQHGIVPKWEATAEAATLPGKSQAAR